MPKALRESGTSGPATDMAAGVRFFTHKADNGYRLDKYGKNTMYVYDPAIGLYKFVVKGRKSILHLFLGDVEEVLGDYATQCGNMD